MIHLMDLHTTLVQTHAFAAFDITHMFQNMGTTAKVAGGAFLSLLAVISFIIAGWQIFSLLRNKQSQHEWWRAIALLVFGAATLYGGIEFFMSLGDTGNETIKNWGN